MASARHDPLIDLELFSSAREAQGHRPFASAPTRWFPGMYNSTESLQSDCFPLSLDLLEINRRRVLLCLSA